MKNLRLDGTTANQSKEVIDLMGQENDNVLLMSKWTLLKLNRHLDLLREQSATAFIAKNWDAYELLYIKEVQVLKAIHSK